MTLTSGSDLKPNLARFYPAQPGRDTHFWLRPQAQPSQVLPSPARSRHPFLVATPSCSPRLPTLSQPQNSGRNTLKTKPGRDLTTNFFFFKSSSRTKKKIYYNFFSCFPHCKTYRKISSLIFFYSSSSLPATSKMQ